MKHLLLAAALAVASTSASAATLTYVGGGLHPKPLLIPQFSPQLGNLKSATFNFDVYADAGGGGSCGPEEGYSETVPMILSVSVLGHSYYRNKTNTFFCTPDQGANHYLVSAQIKDTLDFSGVDLLPIVGTGTFPILIGLETTGNSFLASYSIAYDYNPTVAIPLPASGWGLLLALFGLLGKGLIRRTTAQR